jgi:hypothetical protein
MSPETHDRLQEAVDAAHMSLLLDAGQRLGMIRIDIFVDVEQCNETLRHGQRFSIVPQCLEAAMCALQGRRKPPASATSIVPA